MATAAGSIVYRALNARPLFLVLLALNAVLALFAFHASSRMAFPDSVGYWWMGESLLHGKFSTWYALPKYYPETLRMPGYPAFLALCQLISKSQQLAKAIQLLMYLAAVYLCTDIVKRIDARWISRNVFLILLLPNVQVPYFAGYISSEIVHMFFVVLALRLLFNERSPFNALLLAITCYAAFAVRPAFLLFPFALFVYFLVRERRPAHALLFVGVYASLLIPFGLWNKANHGVFKITPLEGGAAVSYLGFWQLRLPDSFVDPNTGNTTGYDLTKPRLCTAHEEAQNARQYENEWDELMLSLRGLESEEDSAYLAQMLVINSDIPLHNGRYVQARENGLWQLTKQNILRHPGYYAVSRLYHFFRSYVIGVNARDLAAAPSVFAKVKIVYPFAVTFVFIFSGLVFMTFCAFAKMTFANFYPLLLLFWYYGLIHLPFAFQARYTIPIHLLMLAVLAVALVKSVEGKTGSRVVNSA